MNNQSPLINVLLLLLALLVIVTGSYFAIQYFSIEANGILVSQGEFSLGVTSKLGWILTVGFVLLMVVFIGLRRLVDKLQGRF